jgi:hypothetical protein
LERGSASNRQLKTFNQKAGSDASLLFFCRRGSRPLTIIFFSMLYPAPVAAGSALHAQNITSM